MDRIYHGCMTKNADGTNRIIVPGEQCLVPTANCFSKYPENVVKHGVKIRSQAKKLHTVNLIAFDRYFQEKSTPRWIATPHGWEPHS